MRVEHSRCLGSKLHETDRDIIVKLLLLKGLSKINIVHERVFDADNEVMSKLYWFQDTKHYVLIKKEHVLKHSNLEQNRQSLYFSALNYSFHQNILLVTCSWNQICRLCDGHSTILFFDSRCVTTTLDYDVKVTVG
jgi:hypothetical protein